MGDFLWLQIGYGCLMVKLLFYKKLLIVGYSLIGITGLAFNLGLDLYSFSLPGEARIAGECMLGLWVLWVAGSGIWRDLR